MRASIIALAIIAGCAHAPAAKSTVLNGVAMPTNFQCWRHEHQDGTGACTGFRGGQPTSAQLAAMGAKTDIKLNVPALAVDGPHDSLPPGVEEDHHPLSPVGPVTHEQVIAVLFDMEHGLAPVYVHCTHGVDRTGLMVALYRVIVEHRLPDAAWSEWRAFPRAGTDKLIYDAFTRETGFHIPEDER